MLRKRQIASSAEARRWLIAAGWNADGGLVPADDVHSRRPFPVPYSAMASPRVYLPIASLFDRADFRPWIGATEPSSRVTGAARRPTDARENLPQHPQTADAQSNRACGSPGKRQPLQGCQRGKDAPDGQTNGPWGDVFVTEDESDGTMRNSAEVVPCRSRTMGDDGTHDIPRDSGDSESAGPGVFLSKPSPEVGTSSDAGDPQEESRFWLWAGRSWGGLQVRPVTCGRRWN